VSDLLATYELVQRLKDEVTVVPVSRQKWRDVFQARLKRMPTEQELDAGMAGLGWLVRMCNEEEIDFEDFMGICEKIQANVRENLPNATTVYSFDDAIGLGIGAGFPTGLWVGLLLGQSDDG
jgi:hypothetical protein